MSRLVQAFAEIVLHRRGPEEIPASRFLFGLILAVYLAVGSISVLVSEPAERLLELRVPGLSIRFGFVGLIILESLFYLSFVWLVLKAFDRSRRFIQTATALMGAETLLSILGIPVLAWMDAVSTAGREPVAGTFVYFLLFLWSLDVAGFILSKALQHAYFVGVLIMLGYVTISFSLREYLFPMIS